LTEELPGKKVLRQTPVSNQAGLHQFTKSKIDN
jgi:hypothetical protein